MAVVRQAISRSQLCDLLAISERRFIAIERDRAKGSTGLVVVMEPEDDMQTAGTFPQLNTGKKSGGKKGGGKRGC